MEAMEQNEQPEQEQVERLEQPEMVETEQNMCSEITDFEHIPVAEKRRRNLQYARRVKNARTINGFIRKLNKMPIDELKARIPRAVYEGILVSVQTCMKFLKSRKPHLQEKGAKLLLELMASPSFIKAINQLQAEEESKAKPGDNTKLVSWDLELDDETDDAKEAKEK